MDFVSNEKIIHTLVSISANSEASLSSRMSDSAVPPWDEAEPSLFL